jgi:outer membrane immunogenic protein
MRGFTVVGVGLLSIAGFAGTACAADLPIKALAPAAPAQFSWTGCHVGGHLGGGVGDDKTTGLRGASTSFDATGVIVGGQIGCDYQFAPRWVVGVEGSAAWSSPENSHAGTVTNLVTLVTLPSQFSLRNDFLASATARIGYGFADRWLVFTRGGAAWTREKIDDAFTLVGGLPVDPSATATRTGWTIGTGVEWAFAPHWSASLEYSYYDFGANGAVLSNGNNVTVTFGSVRDTIHSATVGMNYHF